MSITLHPLKGGLDKKEKSIKRYKVFIAVIDFNNPHIKLKVYRERCFCYEKDYINLFSQLNIF